MKVWQLIPAVLACAVLVLSTGSRAESGLFGVDETDQHYRLLLSRTIYAGFRDFAPVSYAELPAFSPERGFWLLPEKSDCFVVWSEATENLWYWAGFLAPADEKPRAAGKTVAELAELARKEGKIKFYEKRIPLELGVAIKTKWQRILFEKPVPDYRPGNDGITVVLGAAGDDRGPVFWTVWSPRNGEDAYHLMQLAHAVRTMVVSGDDSEVMTLLGRMEKTANKPAPAQRP
jgi:hypothetical protein